MSTGRVDWAALHRRLREAQEALDSNGTLSRSHTRAILEARARALARPLAASSPVASIEVIEFALAEEAYAVESVFVREVCPLKDLTPLPCTPAFVLGIVNLRGEIVSIVDLKCFFNLPVRGIAERDQVIVLHDAQMTFGILTDRVLTVSALVASDIAPAPRLLAGAGTAYLKGLTRNRTAVLDGAKLLADPKLVVRETVMS